MSVDALALRQETVVQRADPDTLARLGILIGLKLNMFKNGERLKWGYLDNVELRRKGLSEEQIVKLKGELQKAEKIYLDLQGDVRHFRQAVLNGAGNALKVVPAYEEGLGSIESDTAALSIVNAPVSDLYRSIAIGAGLGNLNNNQNAQSLNAGTTWLKKISVIAGNVSEITSTLDSTTQQAAGTSAGDAMIPTSEASVGSSKLGAWYQENKKTALAVGAILAAGGLFVTGMNHEEPKKRRTKSPKTTAKKRTYTPRSAGKKRKTNEFKVVPLQ